MVYRFYGLLLMGVYLGAQIAEDNKVKFEQLKQRVDEQKNDRAGLFSNIDPEYIRKANCVGVASTLFNCMMMTAGEDALVVSLLNLPLYVPVTINPSPSQNPSYLKKGSFLGLNTWLAVLNGVISYCCLPSMAVSVSFGVMAATNAANVVYYGFLAPSQKSATDGEKKV